MLLDRQTFAERARLSDVVNPGSPYSDQYLLPLLQAVEDEIGAYLHFAPALQRHVAEQGPVEFTTSGAYAGRYEIALQHRPLPPVPASLIFTSLQLTYALAFAAPAEVLLTYVTMDHGTGRLYALASGLSDALMGGVGFQYGTRVPGYATGYTASYVAGYATGVGDPTPDGTLVTSYLAPPLPEDIRQAAILLARERLMVDDALALEPTNPSAGTLTDAQLDQWKLAYRKPRATDPTVVLGHGTPLSQDAQQKLSKFVRSTVVMLL